MNTCTAVLIALPCIASGDALAQQVSPGVIEIWGGATTAVAGPSGTVVSAFSPPLLFDGADSMSHAAQTLAIDAKHAVGATGGVNVFTSARVGVQLLADFASFDLGATNTPYAYTLSYISRQPPDNAPRTVTVGDSLPWPDTSGTVKQLSMALNAAARFARQGTRVTLSGGPTLTRVSGSIQPVGYTAFNLGGHSVLFSNQYRLAVVIDPEYAIGFNAGADVDVALGAHAAVMLGYRYFGGRDAELTAKPAAILNPEEITLSQPLEDIAARIAPLRVRLSLSGSRIFAGLKLRY